ncbi:MAG: DUF817 domain-containing protein [Gemmataceae bacterium]|nr:DUF817 domain-containing protein [Gemmataceae bacterium]
MKAFLVEFVSFGLKQAFACLFAASFMLCLVLSKHLPLLGLHRYDFLCLAAIALQAMMLATGLETWREACVLCAFHFVGFCLEAFKTQPGIGAWSYPEPGWLKLMGVPLYSGFMYASVASYMCQSWRLLRLRLVGYPSLWVAVPLGIAIYANFFTLHWLPDARWALVALVFLVFGRTTVLYRPWEKDRRMPLVLSFLLIGFFIWIAENFSTYFGGWNYPHQRDGWQVVHWRILSSWFLMTIVSFVLVASLKHAIEADAEPAPAPRWPGIARIFGTARASAPAVPGRNPSLLETGDSYNPPIRVQ